MHVTQGNPLNTCKHQGTQNAQEKEKVSYRNLTQSSTSHPSGVTGQTPDYYPPFPFKLLENLNGSPFYTKQSLECANRVHAGQVKHYQLKGEYLEQNPDYSRAIRNQIKTEEAARKQERTQRSDVSLAGRFVAYLEKSHSAFAKLARLLLLPHSLEGSRPTPRNAIRQFLREENGDHTNLKIIQNLQGNKYSSYEKEAILDSSVFQRCLVDTAAKFKLLELHLGQMEGNSARQAYLKTREARETLAEVRIFIPHDSVLARRYTALQNSSGL